MSDVLAIVDPTQTDDELVAELIRRHTDRVTLLVESDGLDWTNDDSPRGLALSNRVAALLAAIETRTGAVVVGLVNSREQLRGWRFDQIIGGLQPQPAL